MGVPTHTFSRESLLWSQTLCRWNPKNPDPKGVVRTKENGERGRDIFMKFGPQNFDNVVFCAPPSGNDDYVQEVGRARRHAWRSCRLDSFDFSNFCGICNCRFLFRIPTNPFHLAFSFDNNVARCATLRKCGTAKADSCSRLPRRSTRTHSRLKKPRCAPKAHP